MLTSFATKINQTRRELVEQMLTADLILINGSSHIMPDLSVKGGTLDEVISNLCDLEDYQNVFKVGNHRFNWWEIKEEFRKAGKGLWIVGDTQVQFINLQK